MPDLVINSFRGAIPRVGTRLIPDNTASECFNTNLNAGELRGLRAPSLWHEFPTSSSPKRAFQLREDDSTKVAWYYLNSVEGEVLKSPLVDDANERFYIFERGQAPRVLTFSQMQAYSTGSPLAIGAPTSAPTLSVAGGSSTLTEDRVYTYAYVTEWGEETAIAPVAVVKNIKTDATVTISGLNATIPTIEGRNWEFTRIYRSIIGGSTASMRFVADIANGTASYVDSKSNAQVALNDAMPPYSEDPPSGIYGARVHPSGSIVAFKNRTLYFSRPYLPHSWPSDWRLNLPDIIVGLEIMGQNIMVLTKGNPVMVYGTSPASMGMDVSPFPSPCLGYTSIVATQKGVYYAAEDGLMRVTPGGVEKISEPVMTSQDWQDLCRSNDLRALATDTQYVAFNVDGTGFVFDWTNGETTFQRLSGMGANVYTFMDRLTGLPGVLVANKVYKWGWGSGEETDYRWKSKEFYLPKPDNFEAIQIELEPRGDIWTADATTTITGAGTYTDAFDKRREVVVRIWADRRMRAQLRVPNRTTVPLPAGFKATTWQIEIEGQCRVHSVTMTSSSKGQDRV